MSTADLLVELWEVWGRGGRIEVSVSQLLVMMYLSNCGILEVLSQQGWRVVGFFWEDDDATNF